MKIAFINPSSKIVNKNKIFKSYLTQSPYMYFYNMFWSGFSNGLLNLAAITPQRYQIKYIDEKADKILFDEEFDIVGITATTQQATRAYQIAGKFKKIHGNRTVVAIGGSHATFLPLEAKKYCDVIFRGEAENSWPRFLADFEKGSWKSSYDAKDYGMVDLAKIPIPRYDLLNPSYYKMAWIQTTRGCPRNCEFCSATKFFGVKYRSKTINQIISEIEAARKYLKFQQILFSDDNMFLDLNRSQRFLKKVRKLNISFVAQADIGVGKDKNFLRILKESGCSVLFIGFESIESKNLELMNNSKWKLNLLNKYPEYIKNITNAGIGVYGAFIVGYDWDTKVTFKKLSKFITDNYLAGVQITFLTPLPGTELRERYEKEGRVLKTTWENYTFFDVNIKHPKLTKRDLEIKFLNLYKSIYNERYLREKNLHFRKVFQRLTPKR